MLARPEIRDIMDNFNDLAGDAAVRVTYKKAMMRQALEEVTEIMNRMAQLTEIMVELRQKRRETEPLTEAMAAGCDRRERRIERELASAERRLRKAVKWVGTGWHFAHIW